MSTEPHLFGLVKVGGAILLAGLGAAFLLSLPEGTPNSSTAAIAAPTEQASQPAEETAAVAQDSSCEKQAWPYIDRRCADMAAIAPDQATRQVRVVSTDRGTSPVIITPVASVTPKPRDMPMQAAAANIAPQGPAPLPQPKLAEPPQTAASGPAPEFVATAMAMEVPSTTASVAEKAAVPAQAPQKIATAPKLKAAAKTDRRSKSREQNAKSVPADVIAAIDAVETVRNGRSRTYNDGSDVVSVSYRSRPAQGVFLVPRESDW